MKISTIILIGICIIGLVVAFGLTDKCISYYSPDKSSEIEFCAEDYRVFENVTKTNDCLILHIIKTESWEICNEK